MNLNWLLVVRTLAVAAGIFCAVNIDLSGSAWEAGAPIGVFLCFCVYAVSGHIARFRRDPGRYAEDMRQAKIEAERRDFNRDGSFGD